MRLFFRKCGGVIDGLHHRRPAWGSGPPVRARYAAGEKRGYPDCLRRFRLHLARGPPREKILKRLGELPYTLLFLDGRHENYDLLAAYEESEWHGGRAQVIEGNLVHLMRGEIYDIEDESYFVFGGGESDDHDLRADSKTWWEAEMPTAGEMTHGLENLEAHGNQVDYVLTHEPSARSSGYLARGARINGVNVYLNQVEERVRFKRWFFGCLHMDKTMSKQHIAVFSRVVPVHEPHHKKK